MREASRRLTRLRGEGVERGATRWRELGRGGARSDSEDGSRPLAVELISDPANLTRIA
jgi:hypothetical protein